MITVSNPAAPTLRMHFSLLLGGQYASRPALFFTSQQLSAARDCVRFPRRCIFSYCYYFNGPREVCQEIFCIPGKNTRPDVRAALSAYIDVRLGLYGPACRGTVLAGGKADGQRNRPHAADEHRQHRHHAGKGVHQRRHTH